MASFVSFLGSIPTIVSLVDQFVQAWVKLRISLMKKDIRDGIKDCIEKQDQIDLEKAIGDPHAGEPTNHPGTSIVDHIPGVSK